MDTHLDNIQTQNYIEYELPTTYLLQDSGLGVPEYAGRTCYDSFDKSENSIVKELDYQISSGMRQDHYEESYKNDLNGIGSSQLLHDLSWVYFHESVIEHANLSFLIKGTSRGVLQELARHRIASYSVRSTRYTMSSLINAFVIEKLDNKTNTYPSEWFINTVLDLELFVTTDKKYNTLQINDIWFKLSHQFKQMGEDEFIKIAIAKSSMDYVQNTESKAIKFKLLENGKAKRNVGDAFKHIVNDNWKVDLVVTMNLRSLKNFFKLRDSGAAYFQIRWLSKRMKEQTPSKYLDLIVKSS